MTLHKLMEQLEAIRQKYGNPVTNVTVITKVSNKVIIEVVKDELV